eukprot:m.40083 g.40083  ORF g.40083 m.40083 type:complete len:126 (+) comp8037_c0_seq1:1226-1603(+)
MAVSPTQPQNAHLPMVYTLCGMSTATREPQSLKASAPMTLSDGNLTTESLLQPAKQLAPSKLTVDGIVTATSPRQCSKAWGWTNKALSGIRILYGWFERRMSSGTLCRSCTTNSGTAAITSKGWS